MSDATTPANPTDQIATVAARPVVALDGQRYGHDEAMADIFDLAHIETEFEGYDPRVTGLAAYIERLEAERDALLASNKCGIHESCSTCHHENSNDEKDERTCIQKLHDDFHAAEIDKLVAQRARYEFEADFARCRAALAEAEERARVLEAERDDCLECITDMERIANLIGWDVGALDQLHGRVARLTTQLSVNRALADAREAVERSE